MKRTGTDRIFILGLDGLEYELVERWNLVHLKQSEYGKLEVPINEKSHQPLTPEVWGAFLVGKQLNVDIEKMNHPLVLIFRILKFLRKYINISLGLGNKIQNKIPVKRWGMMKYGIPLDQKTFLNLTKSKAINVPFYNNDTYTFHIAYLFDRGELSLKQAIKAYQRIYMKRKEVILSEVEKIHDENVIFAYMHFPDVLEHFTFKRPWIVRKHYLDLNNFVSILRGKIEDSTLFLIVSDHGFNLKKGTHTRYGFYSSSQPLNPKPTRITDFFHLILQTVKKNSRHRHH
ncbi:hypothetical protein DRP04_11955 [Archaeoglobales archaeon]|nr:MAG: hypothetical protein DRP04_11955 [Archaeoglobales archaeon]